jgi:hypothetical protein
MDRYEVRNRARSGFIFYFDDIFSVSIFKKVDFHSMEDLELLILKWLQYKVEDSSHILIFPV